MALRDSALTSAICTVERNRDRRGAYPAARSDVIDHVTLRSLRAIPLLIVAAAVVAACGSAPALTKAAGIS